MISEGTEAPTFECPAAVDGAVREVSLTDYLGESIVVLAFYPVDFSPAAAEEVWLRDVGMLALDGDVTVLGISGDSAYSHRAFAESFNVSFPLLSDRLGEIADAYGVRQRSFDGHPDVPNRAVVVIDLGGRIAYEWEIDEEGASPPIEEIKDAVEAVKDDDAAVRRYRTAYEHFRYGRSEYDRARTEHENDSYADAARIFDEAAGYFDTAANGFASARRLAESEAVAEFAASAAEVGTSLSQASAWFGTAARHRTNGDEATATEYAEDAESVLDDARPLDEIPDPDTVASEARQER